MSYYKINTAAAIAAWHVEDEVLKRLQRESREFAKRFGAIAVFERSINTISFRGVRLASPAHPTIWTKPTQNNGWICQPLKKAPVGLKDEHATLIAEWEEYRPKFTVDQDPLFEALGIDWGMLFLSGYTLFMHDNEIYLDVKAVPRPNAEAVEILGSVFNEAKKLAEIAKAPPVIEGSTDD